MESQNQMVSHTWAWWKDNTENNNCPLSTGALRQANFSWVLLSAQEELVAYPKSKHKSWALTWWISAELKSPTFEPLSCSPSQMRLKFEPKEEQHFEGNRAKPKAGLGTWIIIPTFSPASCKSSTKVVCSSVERHVSHAGHDKYPKAKDGTGQYVRSSQSSRHCQLPTSTMPTASPLDRQFKDNVLTPAFYWQLLGMKLFLGWQLLATQMAIYNLIPSKTWQNQIWFTFKTLKSWADGKNKVLHLKSI